MKLVTKYLNNVKVCKSLSNLQRYHVPQKTKMGRVYEDGRDICGMEVGKLSSS